ncbi:DMT family transporter [Candidatus Marinimicrobia bacterium]|nr:DMT family transporter [Candidatus Neomarinimicrobiota bacterium]
MINSIINSPYFGEISALIAALCWSIAIIIFKSASRFLSPILITALKNTIALFLFIILFLLFDIPFWNYEIETIDYLKLMISGLIGMGIGDILFIYALSQIGANRIAIINCFEPAVIYLFSIFLLGTVLTTQQLIGFIIVIISLLIISNENDSEDIDPKTKRKGMFIQISAVILSSLGIVLIKPVLSLSSNDIQMQLWITSVRLFPGFIVAWIIFILQKNKLSLLSPLKDFKLLWKILLSSGLGTFVALSFWIVGYANIEKPPVASIIGQTSVIFIIILSYIFLKEKISKLRIVSILFALSGVILIALKI